MLIGRAVELRNVVHALEQGQSVVVTGVAGIGKTALAAAAVERWGRGAAEAQAFASLRWRPCSALDGLLGRTGQTDAGDVASQLLRVLGGRALVLDDAQWADRITLDVVEQVAERSPVLATWRTGDPATGDGWRPEGWLTCSLDPLTAAQARQVATARPGGVDGADLERLLEIAAGVPLLLEELGMPGPGARTAAALLNRMQDLSALAVEELGQLATIGRPVAADGLTALDELERSGMLARRGATIAIRHAVLADAVLARFDRAGRRRLAAGAVDRVCATDLLHAARLAEYAGDRDRAMALAVGAADRSSALDRGLALALQSELTRTGGPDLAIEAAKLLFDAGAHDEVRNLLSGRCFLDAVDEGWRCYLFAAAAWHAGYAAEAVEAAHHGLARVAGSRSEPEVLLAANLASQLGRGRGSVPEAEAAWQLAQDIGAGRTVARSRLASCLLSAGQPGWEAHFEAASAEAKANGRAREQLEADVLRLLGLWLTGRSSEALAVARAGVTTAGSAGLHGSVPTWTAYALLFRLLTDGPRPELVGDGEALAADRPLFRNRGLALAVTAIAAADIGRHGTARALADQVGVGRRVEAEEHAQRAWAGAELAWADGDLRSARDALERLDGLRQERSPFVIVTRLLAAHTLGASAEPLAWKRLPPGYAAAAVEEDGRRAQLTGRHAGAVVAYDDAALAWARSDRRSAWRCSLLAAEAAVTAGRPDAGTRLETLAASRISHVASRARQQLRSVAGASEGDGRGPRANGVVSGREREVLGLVARGLTSRVIGARLGIRPATVDDHVKGAMLKLDARNRREAVARLTALDGGGDDGR